MLEWQKKLLAKIADRVGDVELSIHDIDLEMMSEKDARYLWDWFMERIDVDVLPSKGTFPRGSYLIIRPMHPFAVSGYGTEEWEEGAKFHTTGGSDGLYFAERRLKELANG